MASVTRALASSSTASLGAAVRSVAAKKSCICDGLLPSLVPGCEKCFKKLDVLVATKDFPRSLFKTCSATEIDRCGRRIVEVSVDLLMKRPASANERTRQKQLLAIGETLVKAAVPPVGFARASRAASGPSSGEEAMRKICDDFLKDKDKNLQMRKAVSFLEAQIPGPVRFVGDGHCSEVLRQYGAKAAALLGSVIKEIAASALKEGAEKHVSSLNDAELSYDNGPILLLERGDYLLDISEPLPGFVRI